MFKWYCLSGYISIFDNYVIDKRKKINVSTFLDTFHFRFRIPILTILMAITITIIAHSLSLFFSVIRTHTLIEHINDGIRWQWMGDLWNGIDDACLMPYWSAGLSCRLSILFIVFLHLILDHSLYLNWIVISGQFSLSFFSRNTHLCETRKKSSRMNKMGWEKLLLYHCKEEK